MNDDTVLLVPDVAKLLGIRERTVMEWARLGRIPASKPGKQWLFSKRQLVEWIERDAQVSRVEREVAARGSK
ncbi:MAG: helix-turn-helix domain-containing protein [Planctomycetota bacterium]|jgi:excisionase family DNA binding protein